MTWFRVEDVAENKVVLVEATTVQEACATYLKDFPPDLFARAANPAEITRWLQDPWPWPLT